VFASIQEDAASIRAKIRTIHNTNGFMTVCSLQIIFLPLKMETVYIKTPVELLPLQVCKCVSEITVLEEGEVSAQIPFSCEMQCSNFKNISFSKN
jgi:hypothetical protein